MLKGCFLCSPAYKLVGRALQRGSELSRPKKNAETDAVMKYYYRARMGNRLSTAGHIDCIIFSAGRVCF